MSSLTSAASASNDHDGATDETPFQIWLVICSTREIRKSGISAAPEVRMIVGSITTGTPKPPAVVVPSDAARCSLCLLYTSDAADERSSVDLGGRRIIKKKKK